MTQLNNLCLFHYYAAPMTLDSNVQNQDFDL